MNAWLTLDPTALIVVAIIAGLIGLAILLGTGAMRGGK